MWLVYSAFISLAVYAALEVIYKRQPPWIILGSWVTVIIPIAFAWSTQGDVAAANKAAIGAAFLLFVHVTHWLYTKAKGGAKKLADAIPKKAHIDDSIYDQIADEMSAGNINGGLMARAIAEADGDKDRSQAIYIKLRAAAIANSREQVRKDESDKEAAADKEQAEADAKEFTNALKASNTREQFVTSMIKTDYPSTARSANPRHWGSMVAHRVGLCFLWYTIISVVGSMIFTVFSVPDWGRFTAQEIGEFIAATAMLIGLALLCYLGTLKLKW